MSTAYEYFCVSEVKHLQRHKGKCHFKSFLFSFCPLGSVGPSWAAFWLCLPLQAIRTGLSPQNPLLLVGMHILPTGTVRHAGRGEMAAYPTQAAFILSTEAAKVVCVDMHLLQWSSQNSVMQNFRCYNILIFFLFINIGLFQSQNTKCAIIFLLLVLPRCFSSTDWGS